MEMDKIKEVYSKETINYLAEVFTAITKKDHRVEGSVEEIVLKIVLHSCIRIGISNKLLNNMANEFSTDQNRTQFTPAEFLEFRNRFPGDK